MTEGIEYTPPDITRALPIDEIPLDRLENPRIVQAPNGALAFGMDIGVGYKPEEQPINNEDRLVVNTKINRYAVIDGLGGEGEGGDRAAQFGAEEFQKGFQQDLWGDDVHTRVYQRLVSEGLKEEGLCYLTFTVNEDGLEGFMAGDVRLIILLPDGRVLFTTVDEADKRAVYNGISGVDRGDASPFVSGVYRGCRVIAASDGLWKNFSNEEVADFVKGKAIHQAMADLNAAVKQKMQSEGGKPDNISIVMYDLEKAADGSTLPEVDTKARLKAATDINEFIAIIKEEKRIAGMQGVVLAQLITDVSTGKKQFGLLPGTDGIQVMVRRLMRDKEKSV